MSLCFHQDLEPCIHIAHEFLAARNKVTTTLKQHVGINLTCDIFSTHNVSFLTSEELWGGYVVVVVFNETNRMSFSHIFMGGMDLFLLLF